jgi:hypothetical protein
VHAPIGNRWLSGSVLRNGPIPPMARYVFVGLVGGILYVTTAQARLTCSQAARAYSSGHIGKTSTLGFLKSCVDAELKKLISSGAPLPTKPAAVNRLICVHASKDFAARVRPLTASELTYLDACLDRAIGSRRDEARGSGGEVAQRPHGRNSWFPAARLDQGMTRTGMSAVGGDGANAEELLSSQKGKHSP